MKRTSLTISVAVLAILAVGVRAAAEDEITAAEKAWARAVMTMDQAVLEQILGNQLIYAHSTGVIETKSEYLGKLKAGTQKYDLIEHQEMTVRPYGDAAVAHCKVVMRGSNREGPFDNILMMMHLWVKQGGRWRLVAHQTTRLK